MKTTKDARKKPKPVAYRFIPPESPAGQPLYALLHELVDAHHAAIADARIALAWQLSWRPDVDGRVTLGQCKKVSDLEREVADLDAYDFVILLRQMFWEDPQVTDHQRRALLDHELHHAAVKVDDHGDPVVDERGRIVYRLRKHDLEEFAEVAERYGVWKKDLEVFAQALDRARAQAADHWIGYQSLQTQLRAAGVSLPIEAIVDWNEAERREAWTWALLRQTCPTRVSEALPDAAELHALFLRAPTEEVS